MEDVRVRFGKALRKRRNKLGVSQEEFADLCELDRTYIGGIERGERNVALVNIEKIANSLRISLPEMFRDVWFYAPGLESNRLRALIPRKLFILHNAKNAKRPIPATRRLREPNSHPTFGRRMRSEQDTAGGIKVKEITYDKCGYVQLFKAGEI